ncbi:MAG: peptidoglycan bridge formation glycyltransferase FemA/FemB family protein [Anaerolineales bacterium]|jgi:lipid II:glycine glycyltransferase (peptidoglycan interpeptide bridge formation enzyme)
MHLLQTPAWGELKAAFGWSVDRIQTHGHHVQVLMRRFPLGLTLAYVPKASYGEEFQKLLPKIEDLCLKRNVFALKIEPDALDDDALSKELLANGFLPSPHTIQPRRSLIIDLRGSEAEILARMHQKTRYNIRLAGRKGVSVRPWQDLAAFGRMMNETADRAQFGSHVPSYYQKAYALFHPDGDCELLVAEFDDRPLAAIMIFSHGERAYYFYGASTTHERNRMPTYLLQWEAIRWARRKGCVSYDLWGVPDFEGDVLEEQFTHRIDGLWGVYRFKRGFGGQLVRSAGAWDRPYNRPIYTLYRMWTNRQRD